jgi:hypothetical protein
MPKTSIEPPTQPEGRWPSRPSRRERQPSRSRRCSAHPTQAGGLKKQALAGFARRVQESSRAGVANSLMARKRMSSTSRSVN